MTTPIKKRIESVRRGEVPEGYKKKIPYIIPQDWQVKKLGAITKRTSRPNKDGIDRPAYSINNRKGFVPQSEQFEDGSYQDLDKTAYKIVRRGEFAYNPARVNVGSIGRLRDEDEVIVSSLYVCVDVDDSVDGEYFDAWTKTCDFFEETVRNTEGSVREYLFYENFANMRMPIPPLAEQQKIAEILSTCDHVIELKQQLLDEKRKQKRRIMYLIFDEQYLMSEFTEELSFNDIFVTHSTRGHQIKTDQYEKAGEYPVIDQGKRAIVAYSNDASKVIDCPKTGLIIFGDHTKEMKFIDFDFIVGADGVQLISAKENVISTEFGYYLLASKKLPNDGYSRHFKYLKEETYTVPERNSQDRITSVLKTMDNEILLLEQELEAWQQKKKALMQLLLTGIVRV